VSSGSRRSPFNLNRVGLAIRSRAAAATIGVFYGRHKKTIWRVQFRKHPKLETGANCNEVSASFSFARQSSKQATACPARRTRRRGTGKTRNQDPTVVTLDGRWQPSFQPKDYVLCRKCEARFSKHGEH
jgi:hypothetical protein